VFATMTFAGYFESAKDLFYDPKTNSSWPGYGYKCSIYFCMASSFTFTGSGVTLNYPYSSDMLHVGKIYQTNPDGVPPFELIFPDLFSGFAVNGKDPHNLLGRSLRDPDYEHGPAEDLVQDIIASAARAWRVHTNGAANGTETVSSPYVHIAWKWFSFPVIVWALSMLFFLGVVLDSHSTNLPGIWKTDILAAMLHTLDGTHAESLGRPETTQDMHRRARDIKVMLITNADGKAMLRS
jgi:hypothetical protein